MTFVHPLFLWALAVVAVPIIIHLFNFRKYKKVYFTNVKFLRELQQESKSKSRLKELLILAARCLSLAALVLAFCQPFIPNKNNAIKQAGATALSLYVDNSFSMQMVEKQGPLFEIAKTRAKEVVKAYSNADRFQIISNDFEGKHQRFYSKEDALNVIEALKITASPRFLSEVINRQNDFLKTSNLDNKKIYVFSDAQRSSFDLNKIQVDTSVQITLVPLNAILVNNCYVDTCWFEKPLQQKGFIQKLHARIQNKGTKLIELASVKLFLNKQQIALSSFSLEANAEKEVIFSFECKQNGFNFGSIKIEDYPVTFDDDLFFSFNSTIQLSVCLINGKENKGLQAFNSLFTNDSLFHLSSVNEQVIDYGKFKTANLIILNQLSELSSGLVSELLKFTNSGGAIVIIPSEKCDVKLYNSGLTSLNLPTFYTLDSNTVKLEQPDQRKGFYTGVFEKVEERLHLPVINKHYLLVKTNKTNYESILKLQNADDFFGQTKLNASTLYLFATPLNEAYTSFAKHALFVPTFYQIALSSVQSVPLSYPVRTNVLLKIKSSPTDGEQPPHIKQLGTLVDMIPERRIINNTEFLYTQAEIENPGFYEVMQKDSAILPLAFNYSRNESDLNCFNTEDLTKIISDHNWPKVQLLEDLRNDITGLVIQAEEGLKLWKLFIILSLLFIGLEVVLLKKLK